MLEPENLNPRDLLKTAKELVQATNGKPRQANLLRATSTAYYALFHTLARSCADLLIGGPNSVRSKPAWHQAYRALEHGFAKNACKNSSKLTLFPQEIQDFANMFVAMQVKRRRADYDPHEKAYKSAVLLDIDLVEAVIDGFHGAPLKDRRAFAAFVLLKARTD
jgi:hypothetical protein